MSIALVDSDSCTGCGACVPSCKKNAIIADISKDGFIRPVISFENCADCHICETKCPVLNPNNCDNYPLKAYCCQLKEKESGVKSSSGGAFVAISNPILESDGVVFGANFESGKLRHVEASNIRERDSLCGSKYLQSDASDSYDMVFKALNTDKKVLFVGTPCQVDALYCFLGQKKYENLYTIDLICHGIPNNKVFNDYIDWLQKNHGKIKDYSFRDKTLGMSGSNVVVEFVSGEIIANTDEVNAYDSLYSRAYLTRPSCFNCKYTSIKRVGDITIGDCWGIKEKMPEWDIIHGTSLVIINNDKGAKLWKKSTEYLIAREISITDYLQPSLLHPVGVPVDGKFFWKYYSKHDFEHVVKLFAKGSTRAEIYQTLRYYIGSISQRLCNKE